MNKIADTYKVNRLRTHLYIILAIVFTLLASLAVVKVGVIASLALIVSPIAGVYLWNAFQSPRLILITLLFVNYFAMGITRYIPAPLGLLIDGLLVLTYIVILFKNYGKQFDWSPAKTDLTLLAGIWFAYAVFQFFNPEAASRSAWFYAMRGIALYMFLTVPLTFLLFNHPKHLDLFLKLWAVFSVLGFLKGQMQLTFGVDPFEKRWLDGGGAVTHLLFGKLRVFSFFTDAGQFGASQGHATVVFGIIAMHADGIKKKLIWGTIALLAMYSLVISGTRGALAVPVMGFGLYLLLCKNFKLIFLGLLVGMGAFVFLKYTTIAQGNYEIRRIRTALDPNNPSLQARLENQQKLKVYLASRPFGGGLGSAGNWGKRFTPNTFLANVPTDSWYVAIWAELGIVGLLLHLGILFYIIIKSSYLIMYRLKNKQLQSKMMGLCSGIFGIMAASYGNGVLGQMPTGIIVYMSMAFLFMSTGYDEICSKRSE